VDVPEVPRISAGQNAGDGARLLGLAERARGHHQQMSTDPTDTDNPPTGPDPAANQTELPAVDAAPGTFTERGEEAETAAYLDEGSYSAGEFAGGDLPGQG
jgi:hypothetical protein